MTSIAYSQHPAILKARSQAKEKMSITQTFVLAHKARSKLSKEASKPDHDLRHLVLTANLLDSLMLHLSQAEQDQEALFNGMVREGASHEDADVKTSSLDAISEEYELAWDYSDSESDSDSDSDDEEMEDDEKSSFFSGVKIIVSEHNSDDEDNEEEVEEEDDGFYTLQRVPSRAPSLVDDGSDSSDDESNPPSPRQSFVVPALTEKERQSLVTTSFYDEIDEEETSQVTYLDIHQSTRLIAAF